MAIGSSDAVLWSVTYVEYGMFLVTTNYGQLQSMRYNNNWQWLAIGIKFT